MENHRIKNNEDNLERWRIKLPDIMTFSKAAVI
jgi:hypothetical protein